MKVSIIIIHWNTSDLLKKQLSLLKPEKEIEIIVVDNKSDQPIIDWVTKDCPNITLIENTINLGYAGGCNSGAKIAKGDWLLFLNPDLLIDNKKIMEMVNYAEKNNIDAVSPNPGSTNYQKPLPSPLSLLIEFSPLNRLINLNIFKKKTLFGGCLLIKKVVLNRIGGWDERFFLWFEDSDLTKRLYDNAYKVGWMNINVSHLGGASFKKLADKDKRMIFFNSMEQYAKKHFSFFGRIIINMLKFRYNL